MDLFVNYNYIGTIVGVTNDGGASFAMVGNFSNPGFYQISINTSTDPDPIVDYDLGVSNFDSSSARFSFTTSFQTVGGPYTSTGFQYTLDIEDLGEDGASAVPGEGEQPALVSGVFQQASFSRGLIPQFVDGDVDGVPVGSLGSPCTADAGGSNTCSDSNLVNHIPVSGLLTSNVSFVLGPTDRARLQTQMLVGETAVPEPSTAWLLIGGALIFASRKLRHRAGR